MRDRTDAIGASAYIVPAHMDGADLLIRARQKLLSRGNAVLADTLEALHGKAMTVGADVSAHLQTLYLTYAAGRIVFASILPRPEGYLELGLGLPRESNDPRLRPPSKLVWRQETHCVHIRTTNDLDEQLTGLLREAYVHVSGEHASTAG